jgi:formylmethanofuran dehydrogenase subunit D
LKAGFVLITGRTTQQADALHQRGDAQAFRDATALVEMNEEDMACLDVQQGQQVAIRTEAGRIEVPVQTGNLPRGMLFMPMGPTANVLIQAETEGSGMPGFKGLAVEIEVV